MKKVIKKELNNFILLKEDKESFYFKAKTGPSRITRIPKKINQDLLCYVGLIMGDGHLTKERKRIGIELTDLNLINKIQNLTDELFMIKPNILTRIDKRPNRKIRYILQIDNSMLHGFLYKIFEIPKGKKSDIVYISHLIKNNNLRNKKAFLIGLFAAGGGKRKGNKIGLTTASKLLMNDVSNILNELNISHSKESWTYKKYKKEYFGLYFTRNRLNKLMRECRSGQTGQILDSFLEKIGGQA